MERHSHHTETVSNGYMYILMDVHPYGCTIHPYGCTIHIHVQVVHVHLVYIRILATNGSPSTRIYFLLKLIIVTQQTKCEERVYGKVAFLSSSSPPLPNGG